MTFLRRLAIVLAGLFGVLGVGFPTPSIASTAGGCAVSVHNPHYSRGAGGVIFKANVLCAHDRVVRFSGSLGSGPAVGPHAVRATNTETRFVRADVIETFYVPARGSAGVSCSSSRYYSADGTITVNGQAQSKSSPHVRASCP
jgi:hypothetical protein